MLKAPPAVQKPLGDESFRWILYLTDELDQML